MSDFVYLVEIHEVDSFGMLVDTVNAYADLKDVLHAMEWDDMVFMDKKQIERVKHGQSGSIISKKNRKFKNHFRIGTVKSEMIR